MQVLIVSGGLINDEWWRGSSETWTLGSTAWTPAAQLPDSWRGDISHLAGVSIRGQFLVTGELVSNEHVIT